MAYFMTWSNFNEVNFAQPYLVTPKRGHEMVNAFIDFYDSPQTVFAGQMPDLDAISVQAVPAAKEYGYLTAPNAMERVLAPMTLRAKAAGSYEKVAFVVKRKDGSVAATLAAAADGQGGLTGSLTEAALAAAGKTFGAVELTLDGKTADSVPVLFNLPAPAQDPALVDDFESYYGDGSLLKGAYSTNCGAGCAAEPLLSERRENGEDFEVDLTELAKKTEPQLVTLPFSQFKGKNGGAFDKSVVQHFAVYCNAIGDAPVDSHMYFDDIHAVK